MLLETLKLRVWIKQRVFVIQPGDVANIQNPILHAIDPATAICLCVRWKAERVRHASGWIAIVRQLPKLLDANAVNLRLASGVETQTLDQLLRQ